MATKEKSMSSKETTQKRGDLEYHVGKRDPFAGFTEENVRSGAILEMKLRISPGDRDVFVVKLEELYQETLECIAEPQRQAPVQYLWEIATILELLSTWLREDE